MSEAEAYPLVSELRNRVAAGRVDDADYLSQWSTDERDFELLANTLRTVADPSDRKCFLNGFRGDRPLMRGHEAYAEG